MPLFGPELGEPAVATGPRTLYDDVDDYHGWSRSPPQSRNGTPMSDLTGWQRSVAVEFVNPSNPGSVALLDQGIKRVTVTVRRNGVTLATSVALRSDKYSIR
ncbi:MAG: hypothetical protein B7Z55_09750 [Planctomycetales bacterium 12-60-4]|nr:MAG: hypothetical protein B7Z55_09750 [Planctomycetales bacterium 12-60-4]